MRVSRKLMLVGFMFSAVAAPAYSQDLLGGLLGGGGSSGDNSVLNITSGSASDSGLVNLGLGGGNGNVADLNIGGSTTSVANANVTIGGSDGTSVNANLLGGLIGGGGVDVNVRIPNVNLPNPPVIHPVNPPIIRPVNPPIIPGVIDGVASVTGAVRGGGGGGGAPNCGTDVSEEINGLMAGSSDTTSWSSASGVQVQRIEVCPELRNWLQEYLRTSGRSGNLAPAVQADALISASLSRSSYGTDKVFAVKKQGDRLVVYVY